MNIADDLVNAYNDGYKQGKVMPQQVYPILKAIAEIEMGIE